MNGRNPGIFRGHRLPLQFPRLAGVVKGSGGGSRHLSDCVYM